MKIIETYLPLKRPSAGPFFKSTLAEIYFTIYTRGMGEDGSLHPQSYQIQSMVWRQKTELHFMHRGGKYIKPTEVFGPGVFYQQ